MVKSSTHSKGAKAQKSELPKSQKLKKSDESTSSSEEASESEASAESDLDDESDVANISSDDDDEDEDDSESEDDFPTKRQKRKAGDDAGAFASAFNAIVGSKLKAHNRKDPILARNKSTQKKLESDKLDAKARRLILKEKKATQDRHRNKNLLDNSEEPGKLREALEQEKKLRKTAQKGVVKLFNAILATQTQAALGEAEAEGSNKKKEAHVTEVSKNTFLDLVKAAGLQ